MGTDLAKELLQEYFYEAIIVSKDKERGSELKHLFQVRLFGDYRWIKVVSIIVVYFISRSFHCDLTFPIYESI